MTKTTPKILALAVACSALGTGTAVAQDSPASIRFAAPVRLHAGDKLLGERRWFPSPVWHDVDGDGRADVVVGDLRGRLTIALRNADAGYDAETELQDVDGKAIDFHNW